MSIENLRNIAIVAHVDHGKTTLVDCLLKQSGTLSERTVLAERVMDSNDQEKERGITILAKNTAITWQGNRINIVDTPGHADFGGEVERVLSMVDSVLILVDAMDGPMPQTRFVTQKAFAMGFKPIVVVNKIDRPGARPDWVIDQVFDLFDKLGATNEQLDFPIVYASALHGYASLDDSAREGDMTPLYEAIMKHVAPPQVDPDGPFQMRISQLDYNNFVGLIGIGRIQRGKVKKNMPVSIVDREGKKRQGKILQVLGFMGLERVEVEEAEAGDIVAISGVADMSISDTICALDTPEALPALTVDEPTISMTFQVNNSPFAGSKEHSGGKFITSRQIRERLERETLHNVALKVEEGSDPDKFLVSGRGELHLSVLIENMRREGFELAVSRPEVIVKEIDGKLMEPVEQLVVDIEEQHQGGVMEKLGVRKGQLKNMEPDGKGRVRLDYMIPARGLIGFQNEFRTLTQGSGLLFHVFDHYGPKEQGAIAKRQNGVMIANAPGATPAYSLGPLEERGRLFAAEGDNVYEGQLIGIHSKDNDLTVNAIKTKPLTNMRASGKDDAIKLTPAIKYTLEQALDFIEDDELVEVTPKEIRLRKKFLTESDRKRAGRGG
ncbi:GTP-binding protein TypA [Xanthomonas translucens pv. arrhenatheri]|jgi:GTP-binding protein|uniref:Large ribosomal subunit assembly factor BipA n=4 Tax=Xanthomonas translucens group TaxID=3390202 RepID=A0A0K2ZS62_9XANT|nr:translational GTPase TypA [Xanthomonas translucens]EKU24036.1 GTP-binding elongation factor protein [Xanthomonas translucens pv. graminis ART-Xtg29]OAX58768.1 GTP-binding protein TypA [Xanthomonas translucens pv. graminis]OAX66994.1 GTP-binding protein TypA [Xanthomonas translucens pv. arrhenatheri]UKE55209.1 translational GTPase TypA [Xanthomonas translucens pv. graminis]UKE66543.1 translational GTPase TypA [Xanthomonas translucens pv. phlei]